jgi:uncharacterized protein YwgA
MDIEIQPQDWILPFLLLGSGNEDEPVIKGSLLLVKEFFVFIKEIKPELDTFYKFTPYDYGPYSFELRRNLESLNKDGLIKIVRNTERTDYYLTPQGRIKSKELAEKINPKIKEKIIKLRHDGDRLGYLGVLRHVYARYPEYTTVSKIKDGIRCR